MGSCRWKLLHCPQLHCGIRQNTSEPWILSAIATQVRDKTLTTMPGETYDRHETRTLTGVLGRYATDSPHRYGPKSRSLRIRLCLDRRSLWQRCHNATGLDRRSNQHHPAGNRHLSNFRTHANGYGHGRSDHGSSVERSHDFGAWCLWTSGC